jgi:hypothetical protein
MKQVLFIVLILLVSCGDYHINNKDKVNIGASPAVPVFSCPTGFVKVPASSLNNEEFCVMKFEAKNNGFGFPVSQAAGAPWVNIEINDAALACQSLGLKFDLISNKEWMSLARNIESVDSNWDSGVEGSGSIFTGHNDNVPANLLVVADENDGYSETVNTSPSLQKRTLTISNGEIIWDISGNAHELVDWDKDSLGVQGYYKNDFCSLGFDEFPGIACLGFDLLIDEYSPNNNTLDSTNGVGKFRGANNTIIDPVAKRGGAFGSTLDSGIFTLTFESDRADSSANTGFRCVKRK